MLYTISKPVRKKRDKERIMERNTNENVRQKFEQKREAKLFAIKIKQRTQFEKMKKLSSTSLKLDLVQEHRRKYM